MSRFPYKPVLLVIAWPTALDTVIRPRSVDLVEQPGSIRGIVVLSGEPMFERRQRNVSALHFSQSRRVLQSNEQVPVRSGLIDQILACRLEAARSSLEGEISPSSEAAEASPENID